MLYYTNNWIVINKAEITQAVILNYKLYVK